jgi:O-antigen/teichoic acid export membrane protein
MKFIDKIKNPFLKKMLVYGFSDGLSQAMPFLVLPIIANYLSPADFGMVTNYNVLVQVLTAFITLSTPSLLSINYHREDIDSRPGLISNLIYFNVISFVVCLLLFLFLNKYIEQYLFISFNWSLIALFLVLFLSINNLQLTKLRMEEKTRLYGIQQFVKSALGAGLSLLFVISFAWQGEGRLGALVLSGILIGIYSAVLLIKDKSLFKPINFEKIKSYFNFSYPLLPKYLATWISVAFQKIFVTTQISLAANGLLSFSLTISSIFYLFITSFFSAYTPQLFKTLAENENSNSNTYKCKLVQTSYLFLVAFGIILFVGYWAAKFLIINFFNPNYYSSIEYLPFLMASQFFQGVNLLLTSYIMFFKKTKIIGTITIILTAINVGVNYYFITNFSIVGAAYSTLLMGIITVVPSFYFSNKIFPMPWFSKEIFTI